jgi:hypothetical protein
MEEEAVVLVDSIVLLLVCQVAKVKIQYQGQ